MPLLETTSLNIHRRGAAPLAFPALSLAPAARTLLLGPSGCGKTTWLSAIGGLLPPTSGSVRFQDTDIYTLAGRRRDRWRGRHCGFVFQGLHLIPSLTVRQNIAIASTLAGLPVDHGRIDMLLERLGLGALSRRKPAALSQGEQQRVAVARAVVNRPLLILADEPTSALDDTQAQAAIDMLMACADEGGTALLIATHDNRIAQRFENKIHIPAKQEGAI